MPGLLPLGIVPLGRTVGSWALTQLALHAVPKVETFLGDPAGSVSRLGDVLVWDGPGGQRVLAGLEGLKDSQSRIEQAVQHIETAQIGVSQALGTLTTISMATLGVTSLATGFMIWRMNSLHARLGVIGGQITDIQTHLSANEQAHLQSGLSFLERFERTEGEKDLHAALEKSTFATHLYRHLVQSEVGGLKRLLALNQCGRYYMLSLTAQARCLVAGGEPLQAESLLRNEKPTLTALARTTFEEVLGKSPEIYLDPAFQRDNVTLESMAEIYLRAERIGAISSSRVRDAAALFEVLRSKVYGAGGWFRPRGKAKDALMAKIKYLMACLEEVERVESLRLRIEAAVDNRVSFEDLRGVVAEMQKEYADRSADLFAPVFAVGFGSAAAITPRDE